MSLRSARLCVKSNLRVDLVADAKLALQRHHVLEAGAAGDDHPRCEVTAVGVLVADGLVADVLDEQQKQNVALVLAGIDATATLATRQELQLRKGRTT